MICAITSIEIGSFGSIFYYRKTEAECVRMCCFKDQVDLVKAVTGVGTTALSHLTARGLTFAQFIHLNKHNLRLHLVQCYLWVTH